MSKREVKRERRKYTAAAAAAESTNRALRVVHHTVATRLCVDVVRREHFQVVLLATALGPLAHRQRQRRAVARARSLSAVKSSVAAAA